VAAGSNSGVQASDLAKPSLLVQSAFYLSVFSIPFTRLYLPGTGERLGITRLVQVVIFCAVLSKPRACLRLVPVALFWFLAYCGVRILAGLWLTPELRTQWWPRTFEWLQFSLPWVWVMFNVLQFPNTGRRALWALVWGCSVCALFHIAGIGVVELDNGVEGRSSVFGENANVVGATYAVALIVLVGLGMFKDVKLNRRLVIFPLTAVLGIGLAKTGSRTAILMLGMGVMVLMLQPGSFGARTKQVVRLLLIGAVLAGVVWKIPTVMTRFGWLAKYSVEQQEGRVRMFPVLCEVFLRSPIYGSGPDAYRFELTQRAMPYLLKEGRTIASHNLALLVLVETGIIGFLVFSSGIKAALVAAWKARVYPCGLLPLALFLPFAITSVSVSDPSNSMVFWFAMAYALSGAA